LKTYSELQKLVHKTAIDSGWHSNDELDADGLPTARQMLAWIALVNDECDECELETDNYYIGANGKPEGKVVEYADAVIRILDMAGACKVDVGAELDLNFNGPVYQKYTSIPEARNALVTIIRKGNNELLCTMLASLAFLLINEASDSGCIPDHIDAKGYSEEFLEHCIQKDTYNRTRSYRHGGKLA
jgi:hypothetical protein